MTDDATFLTGFPGFLGSALLERLLARNDRQIVCLVQPHHRDAAEAKRDELEADHDATDRIELVDGDITDPDLGLDDGTDQSTDHADDDGDRETARSDRPGTADTPGYGTLAARTRDVYHLAAVYDLAVDRDLATAVNVDGTEHVLEFCRACDDLDRLHYVSTCYVSGRYPGKFTEDMLVEGQSFNNHYESSKFLAEVAVQDAMDDWLDATIYRPSIAVGDSETGATQKYDGPYYLIQYLLDQPGIAVLPEFGDPGAIEVNVVPRDFVVDAIDAISAREDTTGTVYQLADPDPPSAAELQSILADATNTYLLNVRFDAGVFQWLLREIDAFRHWSGIDPAIVDYFTHPTRYDTTNATAVLEDAVTCPSFPEYAPRLVDYVRTHPHVDSDPMT